MRSIPFTTEPPVRWPAIVTKVYAQAHPLLWLALILTIVAAVILRGLK